METCRRDDVRRRRAASSSECSVQLATEDGVLFRFPTAPLPCQSDDGCLTIESIFSHCFAIAGTPLGDREHWEHSRAVGPFATQLRRLKNRRQVLRSHI